MAALGSKLLTLADVAKSKDKAIGSVAEVLMKQTPMSADIPYMEMNEGTVHKESLRSALPDVYYRKANQPIPASKSTIEERTFQASHFESKSQIDEAVAKRGGADRVAFNRWNQAEGHIQAMGQELESLIIYGSPEDDVRKAAGLADVYSTLATTEPTYNQVIDAGGSGSDNTSIFKIHWGPQAIFGIYPAGCMAGLKRTDRGLVKITGRTDVNGDYGDFWGYEEQFEIDHGLVVKDYRQGIRIANIDVSNVVGGTGPDILKLMSHGNYRIDNLKNGKGVWYMNRTMHAYLHDQALAKVGAGGGLTFQNYQGEMVLTFHGDPIKVCDSILNTEAAVTA